MHPGFLVNHVAQAKRVGAIGMDYSYYDDVPLSQTQTYTELMEWCDQFFDELFYSANRYWWQDFLSRPNLLLVL